MPDLGARERVVPAAMPGVASPDAAQGQSGPADSAVSGQRLETVFRAARLESAGRRQHWTDEQLIAPNEHLQCDHRGPIHDRFCAPGFPLASRALTASSARPISSISCGRGRPSAAARPMNITSTSPASFPWICRNASRSRRRTRLRTAVAPTRRPTAKPTRWPRGPSRQSATKLARSSRLPRWKSAWMSEPRRSRRLRGSESPPADVRRTDASDGEPLASFRTPTLQHLAPTLRLHPLAEAMRLAPAASVRLKGPLHDCERPLWVL